MSFFLIKNIRFVRNKRIFLFLADTYISQIEEGFSGVSGKDILMKRISRHIDEYKNDFATYSEKSDDYKMVAKSMVNMDSFDLIATGKYHIPRGHMLNPSGPGPYFVHIHTAALKDALESGLISQDEYDEDFLSLRDAIHQSF